MANTKSAKKAVKVHERKRLRNQAVRSAVKTAFRKANEAITRKLEQEATTKVGSAHSAIDKAAVKGIIHKNTAARKKSRLALKLNKMAAASKA